MKYSFLLLCIWICNNSSAQTAEDSVKATVNQLFTAMKNADSAMLVESFSDSAILQTIANTKDHKTEIKNEALKDFAGSISKLQKNDADERVQFDVIKIDGTLAVVWAPYKFYYKGKFSHCGVDSFQMVRINGKWKIQYLVDTRRRENCN